MQIAVRDDRSIGGQLRLRVRTVKLYRLQRRLGVQMIRTQFCHAFMQATDRANFGITDYTHTHAKKKEKNTSLEHIR